MKICIYMYVYTYMHTYINFRARRPYIQHPGRQHAETTYWLLCKPHSTIERHVCAHRSLCDCLSSCLSSFLSVPLMGRMLFTACTNKDLEFRTMLIEARNQWLALHQKGKKDDGRNNNHTPIYECRDDARWLNEKWRGANKPYSESCLPGGFVYMGVGE